MRSHSNICAGALWLFSYICFVILKAIATDTATTADAIKNASMVDTTSSLAGASAGSGSNSSSNSGSTTSGSGSSKDKFGNFGDHFSGVGGSSFASANF